MLNPKIDRRLVAGVSAAALVLMSLVACSFFDWSEEPPPPPPKKEVQLPADLTHEKNAAFLAQHSKEQGVTVTASGLQYREITAGSGAKPGPTSTVTVHYKGTLINGKQFDSSYGGEPARFPLNRVIKGWTEGLQLMREGGKAELVLPSNLGYGSRGAGSDIPPDQVLIFEVQLIDVE